MNSSQYLLVIGLIFLVEAYDVDFNVPLRSPGMLRLDKRFIGNNLFANAQWHIASDFDQPIHPELRQFGALGPTRSMLTEGPLGTFRFGKRSGRPERLSRIDQGN